MSEKETDIVLELISMHEDKHLEIQRIQTEHRLKLVKFWGIGQGKRVLEIGCGQGDTTAVLAYSVGKDGFVHGIDIASPDYGAPITLGHAAEHLMRSSIGERIRMDFEVDVLSLAFDFPNDSFDEVVLSHCSWYFKSQEELAAVLTKARKWAKRLCFAEWDPRIESIEQYPHLLAVLLQAQIESFKINSEVNVRTLFAPADIIRIAETAGWRVMKDGRISTDQLQDSGWEVQIAMTDQRNIYNDIDEMPAKLKQLIASEYSLLEDAIKDRQIKAMPTFCLIAE